MQSSTHGPCDLLVQVCCDVSDCDSISRPAMRPKMNMLHLLRHAKSSAKEEVEDHERPLSRRGRKTARRVGKQLSAKLGAIDLVLCSSARRTRETLDLVLDEVSPRPRCLIEDELSLAS